MGPFGGAKNGTAQERALESYLLRGPISRLQNWDSQAALILVSRSCRFGQIFCSPHAGPLHVLAQRAAAWLLPKLISASAKITYGESCQPTACGRQRRFLQACEAEPGRPRAAGRRFLYEFQTLKRGCRITAGEIFTGRHFWRQTAAGLFKVRKPSETLGNLYPRKPLGKPKETLGNS